MARGYVDLSNNLVETSGQVVAHVVKASLGCAPCSQVLPEAPAELVSELSRRYILLYETITGQMFVPAATDEDPLTRMERNVIAALKKM